MVNLQVGVNLLNSRNFAMRGIIRIEYQQSNPPPPVQLLIAIIFCVKPCWFPINRGKVVHLQMAALLRMACEVWVDLESGRGARRVLEVGRQAGCCQRKRGFDHQEWGFNSTNSMCHGHWIIYPSIYIYQYWWTVIHRKIGIYLLKSAVAGWLGFRESSPNGRKFQVFSRWIIVIQPVHENNNDDGNDNKS